MNSPGELYLILSNIAIIPAVVIAIIRGLYPEASLLTSLATVSYLYHLCQADFFCIFPGQGFTLLQAMDKFLVDITIIWFIMYFLEIRRNAAISFVFLYIPVFLVTVLGGYPDTLIILVVSISILLVGLIIYSLFKNQGVRISIGFGIVALILLIAGFTVFFVGGDPGLSGDYNNLHGTWHVLLLLDFFFIIQTKYNVDLKIDLYGIKKVEQKDFID